MAAAARMVIARRGANRGEQGRSSTNMIGCVQAHGCRVRGVENSATHEAPGAVTPGFYTRQVPGTEQRRSGCALEESIFNPRRVGKCGGIAAIPGGTLLYGGRDEFPASAVGYTEDSARRAVEDASASLSYGTERAVHESS